MPDHHRGNVQGRSRAHQSETGFEIIANHVGRYGDAAGVGQRNRAAFKDEITDRDGQPVVVNDDGIAFTLGAEKWPATRAISAGSSPGAAPNPASCP